MYQVSQTEPKIKDDSSIFSRLSLKKIDEEEFGQGIWNKDFVSLHTGVSIPSFKFATAATQDSRLKSFMDEDTATEFHTQEKNEDQVATLIFNIQRISSIPDRESIAKRLSELLQDLKEEESQNTGISIGSLRNFYSFLQKHDNLKKPAIALTPANDIYVSWRAEGGFVFSIHFLSTGFVNFAIIATDEHTDRFIRVSGSVNAENHLEKVIPWGVLNWAGRERR